MLPNKLHAKLNRPECGWDPVPIEHVSRNSQEEWEKGVNSNLLSLLEESIGGFSGKRVLDLGGGPGHYSVAFAKLGALVTWHDISERYKKFAFQKSKENQVEIDFSLGYMDDALSKFGKNSFDLVFNRICWYYSYNDKTFSKVIYDLVAPGGLGYVDTTHSGWRRDALSNLGRACTLLNELSFIKIGHPTPPHGRIARLFGNMNIDYMRVDYTTSSNDRVLFKKSHFGASKTRK